MQLFDRLSAEDYEQVVYCHDRRTGLRAIIALHSTRLGPALGGTRFYPYASEAEALEDVLRLARAMTYKAAAAGLDLGGGKAVIIGDPKIDKTEALLRGYGRFVDTLGRRYVTAEDVGTTQADMDLIRRETRHVTGVSDHLGGSGDPSAATAYGVYWAMKATVGHISGDTSLAGRHVVVAGVGKVGRHLVRHLAEEGASLTVADVDEAAVALVRNQLVADRVPFHEAHRVACDIFAPCALGGVLNSTTVGELRCAGVVGAANNQLADPSCARKLTEASVVYAPDYIVNAGGVINIAEELSPGGYKRDVAYARVRGIFDTTSAVLAAAVAESITTLEAADRLAEDRIEAVAGLAHIHSFA